MLDFRTQSIINNRRSSTDEIGGIEVVFKLEAPCVTSVVYKLNQNLMILPTLA